MPVFFSCTPQNKIRIEKCYNRIHKKLYYLIYAILRHDQDTLDAMQAAFESLICSLDRIGKMSDTEMDAYLTKIAKNKAYHLYNARKKTIASDLLDTIVGHEDIALVYEKQQMQKKKSVELEKALKQIPRNYQLILKLKFYMNYSNEQIAQQLHITQSNVRMQTTRACRALKKTLKNLL